MDERKKPNLEVSKEQCKFMSGNPSNDNQKRDDKGRNLLHIKWIPR